MEEVFDEYFLKAILKEKDIPLKDSSITTTLVEMSKYQVPTLESDSKDFSLKYIVSFDDVKDKIKTKEEAFALRAYGWMLSDDEKNIFKPIN